MIEPQFDRAESFRGGLACVEVAGKCGLVDRKGGMAVAPQFGRVWPFVDDLARVKYGEFYRNSTNDRYGFIDREGRIVVEPAYVDAQDFSQGMAAVKVGRLWGYIDKKGKVAAQPQFREAEPFKRGLALVVGPLFESRYIDKTGTCVWPSQQAP